MLIGDKACRGIGTFVILCSLGWLTTACGLVQSGLGKNAGATSLALQIGSNSQSSGASPVQVFQNTFWAFAQNNCVQCHGSSQSPLFAVPDVNAAYANAKPYADFNNPSNSLVVMNAGNGHCGTSGCTGNSAAALSAVTTWAAAELAAENQPSGGSNPSPSPTSTGTGGVGGGGSGGDLVPPSSAIKYFTSAVSLPANIPNAGAGSAILRFNLSNLSPANSVVAGGYFEIQIQMLTSGIYHVLTPKLAVKNSTAVKGVHVMIKSASMSGNGSEYILGGQTWNSIDYDVAASTIPNPLPTTSLSAPAISTQAITMPVTSSTDQLVIGFESLTAGNGTTGPLTGPSPSPSPSMTLTPATFTQVNAQILVPKCVSCHGNSGGVSYNSYAATLQTVVAGNPGASSLYTSCANGSMPQGGTKLTAAQLQMIQSWIANGAPNN